MPGYVDLERTIESYQDSRIGSDELLQCVRSQPDPAPPKIHEDIVRAYALIAQKEPGRLLIDEMKWAFTLIISYLRVAEETWGFANETYSMLPNLVEAGICCNNEFVNNAVAMFLFEIMFDGADTGFRITRGIVDAVKTKPEDSVVVSICSAAILEHNERFETCFEVENECNLTKFLGVVSVLDSLLEQAQKFGLKSREVEAASGIMSDTRALAVPGAEINNFKILEVIKRAQSVLPGLSKGVSSARKNYLPSN
ncbi:Uncharacterised protein [Candidatus Gugararchaeum adminiculabundum]|nr:Uncharacterised protein [Candidatus Gugararchaeum adminiculabundum]